MYTTVGIMRNIIYMASARGADITTLFSAAGLTAQDLHDVERKVEGINHIVNLWEQAVKLTGDETFGMYLGDQNIVSYLGLLGYLIQNCPTLRDVILVLQKHQERVSGWTSYDPEFSKKEAVINYKIHPIWQNISPGTARHAIEMAMTGTLSGLKMLAGKKVIPIKAELSYDRKISLDKYIKVYQCPVSFNKEENRFYFSPEQLELPVLSHDKSLYSLFGKLLEEKENSMHDQSESFPKTITKVIMRDFKGQIPSLDVAAFHMNLSSRSFQRKLQAEGVTYRMVTADLKKELATNLLKNSDHKINTIAEVLGYTEPSAFRKAFKSWTNATPVQLKRAP